MNMINTTTPKHENAYLRLVDSSDYDQKRVDENDKILLSSSKSEVQTFFFVLFGYCDGLIACRSFAEKTCSNYSKISPRNIWIATDEMVAINGYEFAKSANNAQTGCYVIPGTVAASGQARSSDIMQMQTLLIDIDDGNTEEKLQLLSETIGEPTLIVESGGITSCGNKKLHIYWQLVKAVQGEDLQQLLHLRYKIALYASGDLHFKSAHQPIRVAGSIYHKNADHKLVKIRSYYPIEYELNELTESIEALSNQMASTLHNANQFNTSYSYSSSSSSSSLSPPTLPVKQILTDKVYAGGNGEQTRFNHLSKVTGYWIRRYHDGLITKEQAIDEITSYNIANVSPPWPEDKLTQMINGIWNTHLEKHTSSQVTFQQPEYDNDILEPWSPVNWQNEAPARKWIIDNWLPRGYVTALYGDGGIGKSLLAQQLITALAVGKSFLDITLKPARVYALMCEDDYSELWRRQVSINQHYQITMKDLANIRMISRVCKNNLLIRFDGNNNAHPTKLFNNLYSDILKYKPDLVVLDTAADLFAGNENSRPQVRQFIQNICGKIAQAIDGAVLLCAHPSESGIQKGNGSCGSTAWNNTVRSRWYLKQSDNRDERTLSRVKSNYSIAGEEKQISWKNGAFINIGSESSVKSGDTVKTKAILDLIESEALKGKIYTMNQFATVFENKQGLGSKRNIRHKLTILVNSNLIRFFKEPKIYGLEINSSSYGYICTDNTRIKNGDKDIKIFATHYKSNNCGNLIKFDKKTGDKND